MPDTATAAAPRVSETSKAPRIRGLLSPVVTPFKADLGVDAGRLIRHCRWLVSQNCGLAVFGTNSEANSLSLEERLDLLAALIEAKIDPRVMMPGTGCSALPDSVRLSGARSSSAWPACSCCRPSTTRVSATTGSTAISRK